MNNKLINTINVSQKQRRVHRSKDRSINSYVLLFTNAFSHLLFLSGLQFRFNTDPCSQIATSVQALTIRPAEETCLTRHRVSTGQVVIRWLVHGRYRTFSQIQIRGTGYLDHPVTIVPGVESTDQWCGTGRTWHICWTRTGQIITERQSECGCVWGKTEKRHESQSFTKILWMRELRVIN